MKTYKSFSLKRHIFVLCLYAAYIKQLNIKIYKDLERIQLIITWFRESGLINLFYRKTAFIDPCINLSEGCLF